jgi:hypothetical protein
MGTEKGAGCDAIKVIIAEHENKRRVIVAAVARK